MMGEKLLNPTVGKGFVSKVYNKAPAILTDYEITRFGKRESHPEYKHVNIYKLGDQTRFKAYIGFGTLRVTQWGCTFMTDKEAAIAVDKKLIEFGKEPVNILKRKV